jgi:hypothetical protein
MLWNLGTEGMAAVDGPWLGGTPRIDIGFARETSEAQRQSRVHPRPQDLLRTSAGGRGGCIASSTLFADHRVKFFWSEVEDVEQELVESDDLNIEGRKCVIGNDSNVVRDDRICASNKRARYNDVCRIRWGERSSIRGSRSPRPMHYPEQVRRSAPARCPLSPVSPSSRALGLAHRICPRT